MSYGFGIVGCGMISKFHCQAIAEVHGAKFIGCVSSRESSSRQLAETFGGIAFRTLDEMLADPKIDIVSICTPSGAHLEPAIAAAKAGKHVIVEKPLEITLQRCDKIIQICRDHDLRLTTIFPSRFHAANLTLKQAIDAGKFGRLTVADVMVKWFRTQAYYDSGQWRGTWSLDGGGALMNQAIHSVDLLTWLMGPVAELTAHVATLAHDRIEVEDVATASLKFVNGALGVIVATTAAFPGMLKKIEIHGSQGSAVIEEEGITSWMFSNMTAADKKIATKLQTKSATGGGAADPSAIGHSAHAAQIRDFVAALNNGTAPAIAGAEGRRSVEIILAIYQAAETGLAVQLPLAKDPVLIARRSKLEKN